MRIGTFSVLAALGGLVPLGLAGQDRSEQMLLEQRFEVRAGGELSVDLGDMDIEVRSGGSGSAIVRVFAMARDMDWAREVLERAHFEAVASGADLRLVTREERLDWREHRRRGWVSLRAEVTVPGRYDLDLRTGDGDIAIGSFEGALIAHTGDGDIAIERIAGPRIELRTGDGDVTAQSLEAGEIRVHTRDGDLVLGRVAGTVVAETGDGDVTIDIERFEGLFVRTGDGDVSLAVNRSIAADVEIEGEGVDLERSLAVAGRIREGRVSGSLNGGGPRLSVRTGDGSIRIRTR